MSCYFCFVSVCVVFVKQFASEHWREVSVRKVIFMSLCLVEGGSMYCGCAICSHVCVSVTLSICPHQQLRWLPIRTHLLYKQCILIYKVSYSQAPKYNSETNDLLLHSYC